MIKENIESPKHIDQKNNVETNYAKLGIKTKSKRFRRYLDAGLLTHSNELFVSEVQDFWGKYYNKKIDPALHLAFMNLTGKEDPRIIPGTEMRREIIPFFNDQNMAIGYKDKNIYDLLISTPHSPEIVLKRVRGNYFDSANNSVKANNAIRTLINSKTDLIIKPSDSNNGVGIEKLEIREGKVFLNQEIVTLEHLEELYGYNFIVQKVIQQHPIMAAPHPSSVNSLRMVTFRWENEIRYLLTFSRFGANNEVKDNAGAGGVCVGVTDSGKFMDVAVDENGIVHTHHPSTNYSISDLDQIPDFDKFKKFVIDLHKDILHHDFISWDIAVGLDGQPIFIEANFAGATWLYQLAAQRPIFGDLTEEVLQYVSGERANRTNRNISSKSNSKIKKLKRQNKRLKKQKQELNL